MPWLAFESSTRLAIAAGPTHGVATTQGAVANDLSDPVPAAIKEERRARFMAAQAGVSTRRLQQKIGRTLPVLIDRIEDGRAIGRSTADAPEIDGVVHIENGSNLAPGTLARVRIVGADQHDLRAVLAQ